MGGYGRDVFADDDGGVVVDSCCFRWTAIGESMTRFEQAQNGLMAMRMPLWSIAISGRRRCWRCRGYVGVEVEAL
jgi:hypothetical protein